MLATLLLAVCLSPPKPETLFRHTAFHLAKGTRFVIGRDGKGRPERFQRETELTFYRDASGVTRYAKLVEWESSGPASSNKPVEQTLATARDRRWAVERFFNRSGLDNAAAIYVYDGNTVPIPLSRVFDERWQPCEPAFWQNNRDSFTSIGLFEFAVEN